MLRVIVAFPELSTFTFSLNFLSVLIRKHYLFFSAKIVPFHELLGSNCASVYSDCVLYTKVGRLDVSIFKKSNVISVLPSHKGLKGSTLCFLNPPRRYMEYHQFSRHWGPFFLSNILSFVETVLFLP